MNVVLIRIMYQISNENILTFSKESQGIENILTS